MAASGPDGPVEVTVDAVVVANGHNRVPRLPDPGYPGSCTAEQIHSHDYRGPEQLAGRRVLVVGGGNSAMDIAVDASYAATRTLLSLRRGVWVVPKYLLGRPSDTLNGALARRLPWRLRQRISQTMLSATVGSPARYGLPAPTHGFLQDHPTLSDGLLSRLTHGDVEARPGVAALDGDRVEFTDGRSDSVDLIVWCTGYRVDDPVPRPGAARRRRRHPAVVPARVPPRRPRAELRRADAVHRLGVPPGRGAGQADRRAPRRPVRAAGPGRGSAPRAGPSCGPRPPAGVSAARRCGWTSTSTWPSWPGS